MRGWMSTLALLATLWGAAARASDHQDAPAVLTDPSTDITDLYAWTSPDATKVFLALGVFPSASAGAKFSTAALYVFHLNSFKSYDPAAGGKEPVPYEVVCQFSAAQAISCWGPAGEFVTGDASGTGGITSTSGRMRVFAGLRDDPFGFNLDGFNAMVAALKQQLQVDPHACPSAIQGQGAGLAALLGKGVNGEPAADSFRKGGTAGGGGYSGNVLALVVVLDKALVTDAMRPLLGVWAGTHQPAK